MPGSALLRTIVSLRGSRPRSSSFSSNGRPTVITWFANAVEIFSCNAAAHRISFFWLPSAFTANSSGDVSCTCRITLAPNSFGTIAQNTR